MRLVGPIKINLLLKMQRKQHYYLHTKIVYKEKLHAQREGARMLIKESSTKTQEMQAQLIHFILFKNQSLSDIFFFFLICKKTVVTFLKPHQC